MTTQTTNDSPPADDLQARLAALERHVRNMRLAIIVVVAFFIYEALAPSGFHDRTHRLTKIETQDLRLVDEHRETLLRMAQGDDGASIVLRGGNGEQTIIRPASLTIYPFAGEPQRRLELTPDGARAFGGDAPQPAPASAPNN